MRRIKMFGMLVAVICAISALGAANSSAEFTASATGELHGRALENQLFTTSAGSVLCSAATTTGTITKTATPEQHVTVHYSGCTAFALPAVHVSTATYLFTTDGTVHIVEPITITVTKTLFTAHCTITVKAQTVGTVDFETVGSKVKVTPTVTGIHSVGSGGPCGSTTSNTGTYEGASEIERVGGGFVAFDK
jgi:hypothetical protein